MLLLLLLLLLSQAFLTCAKHLNFIVHAHLAACVMAFQCRAEQRWSDKRPTVCIANLVQPSTQQSVCM